MPTFESGPTATPDPAIVNLSVAFAASTDLADAVITWDFGDGSPGATGAAVSHIFTAQGRYSVTATATNPRSQSAASGTVLVLVNDDTALSDTGSMLQTAGILKFGLPRGDAIETTCYFPLNAATKVPGLALDFSLGGLARHLMFNARGDAAMPEGTAHMGIVRFQKTAHVAKLSVRLKGALKAELTTGVSVDQNGLPLKTLLIVTCDGSTYSGIGTPVFKTTKKVSVGRFVAGSATRSP